MLIIFLGASLKRKEWDKIKNEIESSFENVVVPTDDDYDLLASSIFTFVEAVMDMESKGQFPTYAKAQELIDDSESMKYYTGSVSQKDGAICRRLPDDENAVGSIACSFDSNYDANNATVDIPMKQDLAADKTLDTLLAYAETLADNTLKAKNEEEEEFEPIMSVLSPYLLGDGNPIWGIYKQLRKADSNAYKRRMPAYFGGFHLGLETHKKRGSLFGDSHLCDIFREWRPTDGMLKWVMEPGDPGQVESELIMYHLGELKMIHINLSLSFFQTYSNSQSYFIVKSQHIMSMHCVA